MNVSPLRRALGRTPDDAVRRITLITKPGCHLCDDARAVVEKVAAETGAEVEEINMLEHPDLVAKYAEQIPVTLVDGKQHDYWRASAEVGTKGPSCRNGPHSASSRGRERRHATLCLGAQGLSSGGPANACAGVWYTRPAPRSERVSPEERP